VELDIEENLNSVTTKKLDVVDNFDIILNKLINLSITLASIAIFLMMVFVLISSVGRYITGTVIIPGLIEMTGFYLMPLAVFPAFAYSYMSGTFPMVDNLANKCPERVQFWIKGLYLLLEVILFALVTYFTLEYALIGTAKNMQMRAGANLWPLYPFFYTAPYGFALLTLKAATAFLKLLKNKEEIISTVQVE
jgi:TRAP-type C4-dicarboxylate transport system permease small subunit